MTAALRLAAAGPTDLAAMAAAEPALRGAGPDGCHRCDARPATAGGILCGECRTITESGSE